MRRITEHGNGYHIDNILITQEAQEQADYSIVYLPDFIDELINWISEASKDKEIMKQDLKYLFTLKDEYILSSLSTNEYISPTENEYKFNIILDNILEFINT